MVTPSQTKVWLEILQFRPMSAFFCTSTNVPIFVPSPISHPYRLIKPASFTSLPSFTLGAMRSMSSTEPPPLRDSVLTRLPPVASVQLACRHGHRSPVSCHCKRNRRSAQLPPLGLRSAPPVAPTCHPSDS